MKYYIVECRIGLLHVETTGHACECLLWRRYSILQGSGSGGDLLASGSDLRKKPDPDPTTEKKPDLDPTLEKKQDPDSGPT